MSREFEEPNYIECVSFDPRGEFIGQPGDPILNECDVCVCVCVLIDKVWGSPVELYWWWKRWS